MPCACLPACVWHPQELYLDQNELKAVPEELLLLPALRKLYLQSTPAAEQGLPAAMRAAEVVQDSTPYLPA